MIEIKDSGTRRSFESGAVRDISEDKGRMDLLPLSTIADFHRHLITNSDKYNDGTLDNEFNISFLFSKVDDFVKRRDKTSLYQLLAVFMFTYYPDVETALLELSIHYQQGARKYCERNWEQGIDAHSYVDSALRHGVKCIRGDEDEPHNRAFMWNIFGLIWTLDNKPELDDLYKGN